MANGGLCYGERANKRTRCRKRRLKSTGSTITHAEPKVARRERRGCAKRSTPSPDLDASRVASKKHRFRPTVLPPRVLCLRLLIWRDFLGSHLPHCVRMSLLLIILPGSSRLCALCQCRNKVYQQARVSEMYRSPGEPLHRLVKGEFRSRMREWCGN
jgi:hypothetical protein